MTLYSIVAVGKFSHEDRGYYWHNTDDEVHGPNANPCTWDTREAVEAELIRATTIAEAKGWAWNFYIQDYEVDQ